MEIILAILLLIGAVSMGPSTAGKGEAIAPSKPDLHQVDDTLELHPVMPAVHQRDSTRCHTNGDVIYRDLTAPYSATVNRLIIDWSDCDDAGPYE